jgi:plastocyanin
MRLAVAAISVASFALSSCSSDDGTENAAGTTQGGDGATATTSAVTVPANGESMTVLAVDNSFQPDELTVAAGTEVVWENNGRNDHNIIPENENAAWRVDTEDFEPGASASHVFNRAGTYRYYCSIHGTIDAGMPGVIIVE